MNKLQYIHSFLPQTFNIPQYMYVIIFSSQSITQLSATNADEQLSLKT